MKNISTICLFFLAVSIFSGSGRAQSGAGQGAPRQETVKDEIGLDHGGKIEAKYDGFRGETVVSLEKMKVNCASLRKVFDRKCVRLAASVYFPGRQQQTPGHVRLTIILESKDWHNEAGRLLTVIADGRRIDLGRMSLSEVNFKGRGTKETVDDVLEVTMHYRTFEQIARAEAVEMRLGDTTFQLRDKNMAALRELISRREP